METFPVYGLIEDNGYTQKRASAIARTQMSSGPPKQLKTMSRVIVSRTLTYWLQSKADFASFVAWFETNINYGADWFNWTDPLDGVVKLARIVTGLDVETPFEAAMASWKVNFTLETWSA